MSNVIVKINRTWSKDQEKNLEVGLLQLITDVDRRSAIIAPKETSALVNSRRITKLGAFVYQLKYGSARVPYARRRHFENKKNPQTLGYLDKAADSVARGNKTKYFRGNI